MSLEISRVCASLDGSEVLKDITFAVPEDAMTGLIGPNGAGKSTLFSVISGFLPSSSGEISLGGDSLAGKSPVQRVRAGMVRTFQVPREFRHMTVRENLLASAPDQPGERLINLALRPGKVRERERQIRDEAESVLTFLQLGSVADLPAGLLSGGQKKLLELGRVMMVKPRLILLDEPFAGVNAVLVKALMGLIRELHSRGIGFLIIEHELGALSELVNELHVLDRGSLLASGEPHAVLSDSKVREAYLGGAGR